MEKYYAVYFDDIGIELTLFENKFLSAREYIKSVNSEYIFTDVVYEEKVLKTNVKFLSEAYLYDGYKLNDEVNYYCNDYDKDGFMYDRRNHRVVYGKTPIYVKLVGDSFVDVVTGQVIPRNLVKMSIEIDSAESLHAMANDLIRLSKYANIYSIILSDWISMFSTEIVNMCAVQEIYDYLCFKKYREEYGELALECCDFESIGEDIRDDTVLQVGEHQKIRQIIRKARERYENSK